MKIHSCSDLHTEFSDYNIVNNTGADVLLLAGDILMAGILHDCPEDSIPVGVDVNTKQELAIQFRNFLQKCSEQYKHVIYVLGNHERYRSKFNSSVNYLKQECVRYKNIHVLENESIIIDNIKFIGCTLWTDLNKNDPITEMTLKNGMSDYKVITYDGVIYRKLNPRDTYNAHMESVRYINKELKNYEGDVIIVTHHAPSFISIDEDFKDDHYMNGGYCSSLENIMYNYSNIKCWFHGHLHKFKDYNINNTRIICNPRGYHNHKYNENTNFNPLLVIDI